MKVILKISIISIILCTLISIPVFAKTGKVVNTEEVRFRAKASATEDSEVLGKVIKGTTVEILEKITGWYKVEYNGQTGYINSAYLEEVADETTPVTQTAPESQNTEQPTTNTTQEPDNQTTQNITEATYKTIEKVSVRLMPLINSSVISTLSKDTNCTVITTAGNWAYIETSTIKGWVLNTKITNSSSNSQNTDSGVTTTPYTETKIGYVNLNSINVRKEPSTTAELVTTLTLNTEVKILGEDGDWYLVELNGEKVYIYKELLSDSKVTTTSRSSDFNRTEVANTAASVAVSEGNTVVSSTGVTGNDVVAYAKQFLGYPYVYATAGPNTFDCSGFTSYVYKHFGYNISRSSSAQRNEGIDVAKENLQPGDIIIFLNTARTAIGHVGIYIGNNQFIHASSSTTGVIISDLSSANYPQRYVTARRILN